MNKSQVSSIARTGASGQPIASIWDTRKKSQSDGSSIKPLEADLISGLRQASFGCASREFERMSGAEDYRGHAPGPEVAVYPDDPARAVQEYDVDGEAHEKHVHPHKRREAAVVEQQAFGGVQIVAAEQTAALTAKATRVGDALAQNGASSLIDRAHQISHCVSVKQPRPSPGLSRAIIM
jgi:hypothetical protein